MSWHHMSYVMISYVICHDVIYHNIICHEVMCHNIINHDIICHAIKYNDVTCNDAIYHDVIIYSFHKFPCLMRYDICQQDKFHFDSCLLIKRSQKPPLKFHQNQMHYSWDIAHIEFRRGKSELISLNITYNDFGMDISFAVGKCSDGRLATMLLSAISSIIFFPPHFFPCFSLSYTFLIEGVLESKTHF